MIKSLKSITFVVAFSLVGIFLIRHVFWFVPFGSSNSGREVAQRLCTLITKNINMYQKEVKCVPTKDGNILVQARGFEREDEINNFSKLVENIRRDNFSEIQVVIEIGAEKK